jgi:protoheme IX farnesyltransferase
MWTPPHFWALALVRADEYKQVGVPMLPVIAGAEVTRIHIFWYSIALVLLTFAPVIIGLSGAIYGIGAGLLGAVFVTMAMLIRRRKRNDDAQRLFSFSILYLFLIFVLLAVDHMSWSSTFLGS